jgi:hypothetical protein
VPTFADRVCHVVSATDPRSLILGFLDKFLYIYVCKGKEIKQEMGWKYKGKRHIKIMRNTKEAMAIS